MLTVYTDKRVVVFTALAHKTTRPFGIRICHLLLETRRVGLSTVNVFLLSKHTAIGGQAILTNKMTSYITYGSGLYVCLRK